MNTLLYIDSKCIKYIHSNIELLLTKKIYRHHHYLKIDILYRVFENIKPFLLKINKILYEDNIYSDEISMAHLNKSHDDIQYLFYIIKGYQFTINKTLYCINENEKVSYEKQEAYLAVNNIIVKLLKLINKHKRISRLKRRLIKITYIDNYTKKKFYKNIRNYIEAYL